MQPCPRTRRRFTAESSKNWGRKECSEHESEKVCRLRSSKTPACSFVVAAASHRIASHHITCEQLSVVVI
eukprot:2949178-Rhodomonas_salina.1